MKIFFAALIILFFASCLSEENQYHGFKATGNYAFDSSFQYYKYIGPDVRPGIWVQKKPWPKISKRK